MKPRVPRLLALVLTCLTVSLAPPRSSVLAVDDTPPPLGSTPLPAAQSPTASPEAVSSPKPGAKGKPLAGATPKPARAKKPKEFAFPLPIGESGKSITIPQIDQAGNLLQKLMALKMTHIDNEHVEMHEATIDLFHPDGKEDFHVLLPDSILDLKTQIITSDHPVTVRTEEFELTGERMAFNTVDRTGELLGNVHMVIRNLKQVAGVAPAPPAP